MCLTSGSVAAVLMAAAVAAALRPTGAAGATGAADTPPANTGGVGAACARASCLADQHGRIREAEARRRASIRDPARRPTPVRLLGRFVGQISAGDSAAIHEPTPHESLAGTLTLPTTKHRPMCCVLGRPLHRSTPWPACCRRRSGATLNLLPGPQSVSRDARPRRKSC